ncbi:MAG TPA: hypothetical protein VJ942_15250 [Roseovarius sp.]|nr:hypothetical protein [Roseovarius sp.]
MQSFIEKGRSLTIGRGLKFILLLQVVIAGLLILTDVGARWSLDRPSDEPEITQPVSPGDQVRRYNPKRPNPQFSEPGSRPDIDVPSDLPPRLNFSLRDEPDIGSLVIMHGEIAKGDAKRAYAFFESLDAPPDSIAINSPGGIVDEALELGRLVRNRSFNTLILPGMVCLSSCPYVIAGGVERRVSLAGAVGLHQHYYEAPGYMPVFFAVEDIQFSQGETMGYLIEMGIDPGVMVHGLKTPPNDIYVLVESELLESRMATEVTE